jgi:hypothetical protein
VKYRFHPLSSCLLIYGLLLAGVEAIGLNHIDCNCVELCPIYLNPNFYTKLLVRQISLQRCLKPVTDGAITLLILCLYNISRNTIRARARWPRGQYARFAIAEPKQCSQRPVIGWVTKIYYLELLCASKGTLSRWS